MPYRSMKEFREKETEMEGYRKNIESLNEGIKRIETQLGRLREAQAASLGLTLGSRSELC